MFLEMLTTFLNLPEGLAIFAIAETALAGLSSIAFIQLAGTFPPTAKPAVVIAIIKGCLLAPVDVSKVSHKSLDFAV